jgi:hypothetical protein
MVHVPRVGTSGSGRIRFHRFDPLGPPTVEAAKCALISSRTAPVLAVGIMEFRADKVVARPARSAAESRVPRADVAAAVRDV